LRALGLDDARLEVHLIQFVTLLRDGETVSMGKRSGNFEILGDVVRDLGVDAARFVYLLGRPEWHLEFDLALAKKQANDNPVFYVQYAHARVCSLRRLAAERKLRHGAFAAADLSDEADRDLLNVLLKYPRILDAAAQERAPHQVVFYLQEIAAAFHGYYNKQRILDAATETTISARLALADAVGQVIADGLGVIGVSAPEKM
jgi:arginyl-tRNA synthetase